jgi:DNA (cytosine-5)-methyltransferase 1
VIRDDYAGPGGWSVGLRMLGLSDIGIEYDAAACATRAAAGFTTIRADLTTYTPGRSDLTGYIASPPCQTFSTAGNGDGRDVLPALVSVIDREAWDEIDDYDDRTRHVLLVARNCATLNPEWITLEQVPPVLPVWEAVARLLGRRGWSVWCGVLCAADFGVPQTRRRAILIASRVRTVGPPPATHAEHPTPSLFGSTLPWIGWGAALGLPATMTAAERRGAGLTERHGDRTPVPAGEPFPTVTTGSHRRHWLIDRRTNSRGPAGAQVPTVMVPSDRPAPTITGLAGGQWVLCNGAQAHATQRTAHAPAPTILSSADNGDTCVVRTVDGSRWKLTEAGCLVLQSFPIDHPIQGNRTQQHQQIGNAIPPLMAAHIAAAATGCALTLQVAA